ncbi:MAG: EAL domain-containing protein [Lachnospiraceae bacterium]|nr:EAL domain-containing protein [Lachnospiraceae bacterium]MDE7205371.1 EAL domain-containing protein [Lachnospiraceae bacterium]
MYSKNTILLVDDEEVIKQQLKDVITDDYEVLDASDGQEALEILAANIDKVAVIVLDLIMPVMDGFQFMDEFRKHQEYDNIPVIVATSNEDWHSEQKCLEAGVWDFVMKPYNPVLLQFRIKNAIDKSRMIMAERDAITGLYTKFKFYRAVRIVLSENAEETFAFARFDIDRFKMINNFYGIKEGDRVLQSVASELRKISTVFDKFVYGRLENDVFAVCMPYKEENVELLVNALQINLRKVNKDYNIKVSCGVYVINDDTLDVSEMYDRAFLAAKNCKGKFVQSIAYYNESMIEDMRQEQFIINEVNRAIDEEQFEVYLQPKINLVTDRSYGAEALVRWNHPEKGMISPGEFIPVYERNGIIGRLDQYMWRNVCKLLRKWIDEGKDPNPISVNVSRVNIYNPQLVQIFKKLITEYQIPAELLNLELTESAFMEDQELIMKTMSNLHQLGFKIMMDDFGSGYSSLNVLKDMEVDYLKVDMKFLQNQEFNGKGEKVLTSVIRMAKWLHLPSIVEGVETLEQVDFLKCIGCEYAQGYYYAKPMPVADYEAFIAREEAMGAKSSTDENTAIINELWNTRSSVSRFFDMLEMPIAIYEYQNEKLELLRTNNRYETDIVFDKSISEREHNRRVQTERYLLSEAFAKIVKGDFCGPMEYELTDDIWYRVTVKVIGRRADTMIMMVTFYEISEYR